MPARGARMYHEAGVGSRTGMRAPSMGGGAVDDLSAYLAAGQRALEEDDDEEEEEDDGDWDQSDGADSPQQEEEEEQSEDETRSSLRKRRRGENAVASSSRMDLEQSTPPSPRRALHQSSAYAHQEDDLSDAGSVVLHGRARTAGRRSGRAPEEEYEVEMDFGNGNSFDLSGNDPRDEDAVFSDDYDLLAGRNGGLGRNAGSAPAAGLAARRKAAAARLEDYSPGEEEDVQAMLDGDAIGRAASISPPPVRRQAKSKATAKHAAKPTNDSAPKKRGRPRKDPSASQSAPKQVKGKGRPAKATPSQQPQLVEQVSAEDRDRSASVEGGVRRSGRYRYQPLEYWRGERARFGRPSLPVLHEQGSDDEEAASAMARGPAVPVLKEIVRVPRAQGEGTFSGMRKKRVVKKSRRLPVREGEARTPSVTKNEEGVEVTTEYVGPAPDEPTQHFEDGWDDETSPNAPVWDAATGAEVDRRIVCTSKQVRPRPAANASFAFEKIFGLGEFMAAGVLEIERGGEKPYKPSKDNNYVFVVIEGAVDVTVHQTDFRLAPGGIFMVPKDNSYSIRNICHRRVRMFFAQARKPIEPDASNYYAQRGAGGEQSFGNMTYSQPQLQNVHLYTSNPYLATSSSQGPATPSRYTRG